MSVIVVTLALKPETVFFDLILKGEWLIYLLVVPLFLFLSSSFREGVGCGGKKHYLSAIL